MQCEGPLQHRDLPRCVYDDCLGCTIWYCCKNAGERPNICRPWTRNSIVDLSTVRCPRRSTLDLNLKTHSRYALFVLGPCLLFVGFAVGWKTSRLLVVSADSEVQLKYLYNKGTASDSVRAGVLDTLRKFQNGYRRRDLKHLDSFMESLFPHDQDTRAIGTGFNEWVTGYDSVTRFIRTDWRVWGNVQLAVEDSVVSSSGNVAWLATTGTVTFPDSSRPIRFTAVLTCQDSRWLFRQIQFQWDDQPVSFLELMDNRAWPQFSFR